MFVQKGRNRTRDIVSNPELESSENQVYCTYDIVDLRAEGYLAIGLLLFSKRLKHLRTVDNSCLFHSFSHKTRQNEYLVLFAQYVRCTNYMADAGKYSNGLSLR